MRPEKILIIKLSAIGDIVMATPVLRVFRAAWPWASISWLVEDRFKDVLTGHPLIDEVIVWPSSFWKKKAGDKRFLNLSGEALNFARGLRGRRFDTVFDLQCLLKSSIWAFLSGAKTRIGLGCREGAGHLMTRCVPITDGPRISADYISVTKALGLDEGEFLPELPFTKEGGDYADSFFNGTAKGDYFVIGPFTTRPQKHWISNRWPGAISEISRRTGLLPIILGAGRDVEAAAAIEGASKIPVVNMAGKTTLRESMAIIKKARLLVGVDTGLTHMGIAYNVPTVCVFGSTCPYTITGRGNAVVLFKKQECSPCRKDVVCGGNFHCMRAITEEDVVRAAAGVLRRDKGLNSE